MQRRPFLRKTFHSLLSSLYLSLSFYVITCSFHHDLLTDLHGDHAHHHSQEQGSGSSHEPAAEDVLFCKFVQKVSGSAAVAPSVEVSLTGVTPQERVPADLAALYSLLGAHPSRAPPMSLS